MLSVCLKALYMDRAMKLLAWWFICMTLVGCSAQPQRGVDLSSIPKYFELRDTEDGLLVTFETHAGIYHQSTHSTCNQVPIKMLGGLSVRASICPRN